MFSIFILLLSTGACAAGVGGQVEEGGWGATRDNVDTGALGGVTQLEITAKKQATDPNSLDFTDNWSLAAVSLSLCSPHATRSLTLTLPPLV